MIKEVNNCRLCDGELSTLFDLGEFPLANNLLSEDQLGKPELQSPLVVGQCKCGSVQLKHTVSQETLFSNYLYTTSSSPSLVKHFGEYAAHVVQKLDLKPEDTILEIGGNDGCLAKHFMDSGFKNVINIEPAANIAALSRKNGVQTLNNFFNRELIGVLMAAYSPRKLITCNNCFAHVDNIREITDCIKHFLARDGVFIFENAYLLDTIQKNLLHQYYSEHKLYHSIRPLRSFFLLFDLEIFDVERYNTQSGSIRAYVQHKGGPRPVSASVEELVKLEDDAKLYDTQTYHDFIDRIGVIKKETIEYLDKRREIGKIVGYTYPAKATLLCSYFDIGKCFEYIVEDSELKVGKFTPKFHTPIKGKSQFKYDNPPTTVVFAENMIEDVIKNNQDYLSGGGRFVTLLPKLTEYVQ